MNKENKKHGFLKLMKSLFLLRIQMKKNSGLQSQKLVQLQKNFLRKKLVTILESVVHTELHLMQSQNRK